jgi:hypothetical protein
VPNVGACNFIKQSLLYLNACIGPNAIVVGDFNRQIIRTKIQQRNLTIKHYRPNGFNRHLQNISSSSYTQYTFFSVAHGTFSKIDHMLGHKVMS